MHTSPTLHESFDFCRRLTRQQAGNFYYSFLTLSRPKRDAMCVIYAWMRSLDDLADGALSLEAARDAIKKWTHQTHEAFQSVSSFSASPQTTLWPAFRETVQCYAIPMNYFDEIAKGAFMDQEKNRYQTFEELYQYCYCVASVVGLVCLRVFGYTDPEAEQRGEWLGIAFQLTNILRDVREDAERGRIYLPLEDLKKYGVTETDILKGQWSSSIQDLLRSFSDQTEEYYIKAMPLTKLVSKDARPTLQIMTEIYHGILVQIRKLDFRVFEHRARVPTWKKLMIVVKNQQNLSAIC